MARSDAGHSPEVRSAIRQAFSVGVPVAAYGVSFGALSVAAGLDIWQTCVLSVLMFSGGSQFALIGVLATGGIAAWPAAIASSTLLGTRLSLYSILMAPILGARGGPSASSPRTGRSTRPRPSPPPRPTRRQRRAGFWGPA